MTLSATYAIVFGKWGNCVNAKRKCTSTRLFNQWTHIHSTMIHVFKQIRMLDL